MSVRARTWPLGLVAAVAAVTIAADLAGLGRDLSLLGHPIVAIAYLSLAIVCQFIDLPKENETAAARVGAGLFFIGCLLSHVEMWGHLLERSPLDGADLHHTLPVTMQVVGAPMFLLAVGPYITDLAWLLRTPTALRELRHRREDGAA